MIDLLNLPGVKPVDYFSQKHGLTVVAEALDGDLPSCPDCTKAMYRHGKRSNIFADTPMQMQPVRLEIFRPRFRCDSCGKMFSPELTFLDEKRRATKRLVDAIQNVVWA